MTGAEALREMVELVIIANRVVELRKVVDEEADPETRLFCIFHENKYVLGLVHPEKGFYEAVTAFQSGNLCRHIMDKYFGDFALEPDPPKFPYADFEGCENEPTYYKRTT